MAKHSKAEVHPKPQPSRGRAPQSQGCGSGSADTRADAAWNRQRLAVNETMTFNELKELLRTTDGNMSVHARKLEEGQYIACEKYFEGRIPKTEYKLTGAGRRALETYLDHMEALIRATREGE